MSATLLTILAHGCHPPTRLSQALCIRLTDEISIARMPLDLHMSLSEANESHLWERITAQTTPTRLKALTCTMRIASPFLHMGIFPELRQLTFKHLPVRHHYSNGLHAFVAAISKGAMDGLTVSARALPTILLFVPPPPPPSSHSPLSLPHRGST